MIENIRLSFQGIWSHKMRSFLTMLGIIIGIASIISIVSTIKGTNEMIKNNLIGAGNNLVHIELYQNNYVYETTYMGIPDGIPPVTENDMESIRSLGDVEAASAYNVRKNIEGVFFGNTNVSGCSIYGIENSYLDTCGYILKEGRLFIERDSKEFKNVVLVDDSFAEQVFYGEDPLGKTIEISSIPFTVIGVVKEESSFEPTITTIEEYYQYHQDRSSKVFVPGAVWPNIFSFDDPESVVIKAGGTDQMTAAGKGAADILNQKVYNQSGIQYQSEDLMQQAENLQSLSNSTNQQLIWIASISLLVGGIGVMNIMLVSVTERTREIGLKKAIGAKKRRILWQFLTEASVLTSLGGIIGVISGIGLSQIISRVSGAPTAISIPAVIFAVVFSMAIGIIFGLIPSVKAANLNPIDALRHE